MGDNAAPSRFSLARRLDGAFSPSSPMSIRYDYGSHRSLQRAHTR